MKRSASSPVAVVVFIVLHLTTVVISQTRPTTAYIYTVLAPKWIRPYSTYNVSVTIVAREDPSLPAASVSPPTFGSDTGSRVVVLASIVDRDGKTQYNSDPVTILPGSTMFLQISVRNLSLSPHPAGHAYTRAKSYKLTVTGTTWGNGSVNPLSLPLFEGEAELRVQVPQICSGTESTFLLVHTDKPIYKPGEVVRFRVLVLDSAIKPYSYANLSFSADVQVETPLLSITIFDSRRNVIKAWKDVKAPPNGIFSDNLTLSTEPVLGDWVIHCTTTKTKTKTLSFSVDQYVLPKFNVELLLPSFATYDGPHSRFSAQIKASYTYVKPVQAGHVVVSVGEEPAAVNYHNYDVFEEEVEIRKRKRSSPPPSPVATKSVQLVNGTAFLDFDLTKDLNLQRDEHERRIRVNATVVESPTGKRAVTTSTLVVHKHPYKVALLSGRGSEYYKPGLPFAVTVAVTTQDGLPVHDERPDALVVRHPFSYTDEGSVYRAPIPTTGLVRLIFYPPSNELLEVRGFEVTYKGVKQWFGLPERVTTSSKVYLNLIPLGPGESGVVSNEDGAQLVNVKVESNKPFSTVYYHLVSENGHGIAQLLTGDTYTNTKALPISSNETTLEMRLPPPTDSATVTLVAYILADVAPNADAVAVEDELEIVPESIEIKIKSEPKSKTLKLNNHLNVTLSQPIVEPGENVTFDLGTRPGSLVALRAVDQSVLILKEDRDINLKSVGEGIESLHAHRGENADYYDDYYSSSSHAHSARVFDKAGLVVMTNAKLYEPKAGFVEIEEEISPGGFVPPGTSQAAAIRVRSHFPETWIWEEIQTDGNTSLASKTFAVPDTLTSWVITGYSIHPEYGLGLLEAPQTLTVVRPFFLTLNVPHSAVRGEVLAVQVLVHNYLDREAEVRVTLDNVRQHFHFVDETEKNGTLPKDKDSDAAAGVKDVKVPSSTVGSVTFIIVPSQFGTIELAVKGVAATVNSVAGDALVRRLIVKPPGQRYTVNKVALIDHRDVNTSIITLETVFPVDRVPGAEQLRLSVVSDILGPTIANLGDLLQMPYGCGEQNLVNFVPDIVILDYLTKADSRELTKEIRDKALRFLESGYQRQLTYAHEDGSFSAFGARDKQGSAWLTAFTIKSFHAAKPYITVDENVIQKGLHFLEGQQSDDGSFKEPGRVLHSELQGGSGMGTALTAYVLLAVVEVNKGTSSYKAVIDKGLQYLVSQANDNVSNSTKSLDLYGLVLTGYALELAKHPMREHVSSLIEKHAKISTDGGFKYWEQPSTSRDTRISQTQTKPVSVEMSSYRLLTYLAHNPATLLTAALPVVKWLLSQRNEAGGFISTQDTVVGLAALAKFAETAQGSNAEGVNLNITANYVTSEDPHAAEEFLVGPDNAIVLQSQELPSDTRAVTFQAEGNGIALVQLTSTYYVENAHTAVQEQQFQVHVKVNHSVSSMKEMSMEVCTRFTRNGGAASNMAVLEVNLPTGYIFDAEWYKVGDGDAELLALPRVMRADLAEADTQLNVYYDHISSTEPSCVTLSANLVYRVAKQSPAYVRVYDYYDTTRMGQTSYEALKYGMCAGERDGERDGKNCV